MRITFMVIFLIIVAWSALMVICVKKFGGEVSRNQRVVLILGALTTFFNGMYIFSGDDQAALMYASTFSCLMVWESFYVLRLAISYTRAYIVRKPELIAAIVINSGYSILMFNNVMFENNFTVRRFGAFEGFEPWKIVPVSWQSYIGDVLTLIYLILAIAVLTAKSLSTGKAYKRRYYSFIHGICVFVMIYVLKYFTDYLAVFDGIFAAALAIFSFYVTTMFSKKKLVGSLLARTVMNMPSIMMCFDLNGECVYFNKMAENIFGINWDNIDKIDDYLKSRLPGLEYERIPDGVKAETRDIDGTTHHFESEYKKLYDKKNNFIGFSLYLLDRTTSISEIKTGEYTKNHDSLTAIYNKEGFMAKVHELLKKEPDVPRVIVYSDIKDFKVINELFGKEAADGLLVSIARKMIKACNTSDSIPGRIGDDHFAVCMRSERYSDELFDDVAENAVQVPGAEYYKVFCYIGVYDIIDPDMPVDEMCYKAALATEHIKGGANRRVAHYSDDTRDKLKKEQDIIGELKNAIEKKEFTIYIQPITDENGNCKGGEVLSRWMRPKKGIVEPHVFIPVFEKTGLITVLDKFIWENACETLRQWKNIGKTDNFLSINISARDFYSIDVYNVLTLLVQKYGISPSNLKVEVMESAVKEDSESRTEVIEKLRSAGFMVALDNYGIKGTSLSSIKDIPVDALKIDMKFLKDSIKDEKTKEIMRSVIELARQLQTDIITMGIESEEERDMMISMGCEKFQGYFFAAPMSVEDFEAKYMGLGTGAGADDESIEDLINSIGKNYEESLEEGAENPKGAESAGTEESAEESAEESSTNHDNADSTDNPDNSDNE